LYQENGSCCGKDGHKHQKSAFLGLFLIFRDPEAYPGPIFNEELLDEEG
jgi:hypothetical protein